MAERSVLLCSYYAPQGDRDSGSRRMLNLIQTLRADAWSVSFAASNGLDESPGLKALRQQGIALHDLTKQSMEALLSAFHFDLVIFAFWPTAEFYIPLVRRCSPATRVLVDSIDLNFLRDARRAFYEAEAGGSAGLLDDTFASHMVAEINAYAAADAVLAISQKEADWINDLVGRADLAWPVPLGDDRRLSPVPFADRRGIVFLGNFQHSPNIEAVRFLCREVVPHLDPAVLSQHPIYIVGHGLNDTVRSHAESVPGVRLVGWVPSLDPYLERARLTVLPLPYGAGVKGKLVQALLTGTPTVSTTIGIEGLDLQHDRHVLVADAPRDFAAAITRLVSDKSLWERLAAEGHRHAIERYSQQEEARRFRGAISAAFHKKPKPPVLPEISKTKFDERVTHQYYVQLMPHIREAARQFVPSGSSVIVVSEGSSELLKLDGHRTSHFLQDENGRHQAGYPADSGAAIAHLERLREGGAGFLLLPKPAFWWMDHYREFKDYLEERYSGAARHDECVIYDLRCDAQTTAPVRSGESAAIEDTPLVKVSPRALDLSRPSREAARLIAFYLPQFHPIPENDTWWGEGFTEWSNVAKATPLFADHCQPHVPADLGFYDLRLAETREAQAQLARAYGIHGFCYYHYWFNGKMLLERPFGDVLRSGRPQLPFCLCWANEPWSRRWDGRARDVLQAQSYDDTDDVAHIRWLMPALADERAITVEGKPLFLVYKAKELPDPVHTTEVWREEVHKAGLKGVHLVAVETGWDAGWDATTAGFDAKVLFQPEFSALHNSGARLAIPDRPELRVFDYQKAWPVLSNPKPVSYRRYETVTPRWDNTARFNESAVVLHNSTPQAYEEWLRQAILRTQREPPEHRIVFLNAWNEWGEGCHLEPDLAYGHAYLEATKQALQAVRVSENHPQSAATVALAGSVPAVGRGERL